MLRNSCPLCLEKAWKAFDASSLVNKCDPPEGIQLLQCLSCGFIYADRVNVDPGQKNRIDYFGISPQDMEKWEKTKIFQKKRIYDHALSLIDFKVNSVCDVGCASGIFIDAITEKFNINPQNCLAVDLTPGMLEYCSRVKGYNIYEGDLHTNDQYTGYDLITFMEVLEHVPYPKKDLIKAFTILNPGGGIIIEVPNALFQYYKSKLRKILNLKSLGLMLDIHVNHFSTRVLKKLLEDIGFRDIKIFAQPSARYGYYSRVSSATKQIYDFISAYVARVSGLVVSPAQLAIARKPE